MDPPAYEGENGREWFIWLWKYHRHRIVDYVAPKNLLRYDALEVEYKRDKKRKGYEWMYEKFPVASIYIAMRMYNTMSEWSYDPNVVAGLERFRRDCSRETNHSASLFFCKFEPTVHSILVSRIRICTAAKRQVSYL